MNWPSLNALRYELATIPAVLFPEFEVGLLKLYASGTPSISSSLVQMRKRHFYNVSSRDNPFSETRNLLFYLGNFNKFSQIICHLGRTFKSTHARLVVEMKLTLPPSFITKHSALTADFTKSVVDLLSNYHVCLCEYIRGGCFSKTQTEAHAARLGQLGRSTLDYFFAETLPTGHRGPFVAPLRFKKC